MIIAGIVLYEPDKERLEANIKAIVEQVAQVVCVDNGSSNYNEIYDTVLKKYNTINFRNEKNEGIAKALNQIFMYAREKQAEWVLTLDQDTVCPDDIVKNYIPYTDDDNVAILSPVLVDRNYTRIDKEETAVSVVKRCITSASLNRVSDWELVGGFYEALFIDFVDHDYCMKILQQGKVIKRINCVQILHEMGNAKEYCVFGKKIITLNHSTFRKYYIVRNWLYYIRNYKGFVKVYEEYIKLTFFVIKTIFLEDKKVEKISAMIRGVRDSKSL